MSCYTKCTREKLLASAFISINCFEKSVGVDCFSNGVCFVSGGGRGGDNDGEVRGRSRSARREDPRRHTLGGDQQYGLMSGQGGPLSRTMDLEVNSSVILSMLGPTIIIYETLLS